MLGVVYLRKTFVVDSNDIPKDTANTMSRGLYKQEPTAYSSMPYIEFRQLVMLAKDVCAFLQMHGILLSYSQKGATALQILLQ